MPPQKSWLFSSQYKYKSSEKVEYTQQKKEISGAKLRKTKPKKNN